MSTQVGFATKDGLNQHLWDARAEIADIVNALEQL